MYNVTLTGSGTRLLLLLTKFLNIHMYIHMHIRTDIHLHTYVHMILYCNIEIFNK